MDEFDFINPFIFLQ